VTPGQPVDREQILIPRPSNNYLGRKRPFYTSLLRTFQFDLPRKMQVGTNDTSMCMILMAMSYRLRSRCGENTGRTRAGDACAHGWGPHFSSASLILIPATSSGSTIPKTGDGSECKRRFCGSYILGTTISTYAVSTAPASCTRDNAFLCTVPPKCCGTNPKADRVFLRTE